MVQQLLEAPAPKTEIETPKPHLQLVKSQDTTSELGHVASIPTVTARGEVVTPGDLQREIRDRQVQGKPTDLPGGFHL